MIRSQLNSYSGSDPIWGFVALVGAERFSGEAAVGLDPRIRLFAVEGRVYFAEREGDAPIGALLLGSGVVSSAQLEQGSVRVGDTSSLARLFQRDGSIDRDAVELTIESATESLLASIANKPVGMPEVFPLRHHSSGVHHWLRGAAVTLLPPTVVDEVIVEAPIEQVVAAEEIVTEDEIVAVEEPVFEEPVFEPHVVEAEMPTIELPVVEEPVVEEVVVEEVVVEEVVAAAEPEIAEPVAAEPVAQSPWHSLVPLVTDPAPQVNGFAHDHDPDHDHEAVEPVVEVAEPVVEVAEPVVEVAEPVVEVAEVEQIELTTPGLLSSLLWLTPAATEPPVVESVDAAEPDVAEPDVAETPKPAPTLGLLTLPSFSSMREPVQAEATVGLPVEEVAEEVAASAVEEPSVAVQPMATPTMPTLGSLTTLLAPAREPEPTPVLSTDFFGSLSDPSVDSPEDQKLPGLPPLNAFEPGPMPTELPKLAAAPISMDELVSQNAQATAEASTWSGATHNLAAVDIWEMVDEIVDDGHSSEEHLVGTGGTEKRSRGWLRGRKS